MENKTSNKVMLNTLYGVDHKRPLLQTIACGISWPFV